MRISSSTRDNLMAGDFPITTEPVTIATGQDIKRGAVLVKENDLFTLQSGPITADSVVRIAAEDVDALAEDVETIGYVTGQFNQHDLIGSNLLEYKDILSDKSIYLVDVLKA